jgi:hypothetical protein
MNRLKPLIGALRQLAKDPNTRDVKYAERQIWVCISQLDEAKKQSFQKQLCDEANREEAAAQPDDAKLFWRGVSQFAADPKEPKI